VSNNNCNNNQDRKFNQLSKDTFTTNSYQIDVENGSSTVTGRRWKNKKKLLEEIFESDSPKTTIQSLSSQAFYLLISEFGIQSSSDLIELASTEQIKHLADFHIWNKDRISEDKFFSLLNIEDETESQEILNKIISSVDLKLLAVVITKYIDTVFFEEPTELQPSPDYNTLDKGYTWIKIDTQDESKDFTLQKTLNYLFNINTPVFYQLISLSSVATPSMIEEEAFIERNKNLASEGIPDEEFSFALNTPLSEQEFKTQLSDSARSDTFEIIPHFSPEIVVKKEEGAFATLYKLITDTDKFESEFTLLVNGAIIRWGKNFSETSQINLLVDQVRGCIEIGMGLFQNNSALSYVSLYEKVSLQGFYRAGLKELFKLRSKGQKVRKNISACKYFKQLWFLDLLFSITQPFPFVPSWWNSNHNENNNLFSISTKFDNVNYHENFQSDLDIFNWFKDEAERIQSENNNYEADSPILWITDFLFNRPAEDFKGLQTLNEIETIIDLLSNYTEIDAQK
jgi:hypothetical protein